MRSIVGVALAIGACVTWTGACASIEGLGQYYPTVGDASMTLEAGPSPGDDSTVVDPDATDDVTSPSDDQSSSSSSSSSSGGGENDSGAPPGDAGPPTDAGHPRSDSGSQPCSKSNCSTCCVDGGCASANANVACGSSCTDCTAMGKACSGGSCVSTSCTAQSCTNSCTPYFVQCCKGSGGCGCSLLFPPGPCT
ncbi:MAG: hypothetical protein ACRENE_06875 [Polyangiaceae bacterium]